MAMRLGDITVICGDERGFLVLDGDSLVEGIEDMLPGIDSHLGRVLHDRRIIV